MGNSLEQLLLTTLPALVAAIPGIIALIAQNKRESKKLAVESQISLSDASLRWVDRVEKELLTLKEHMTKLEEENKILKRQIDLLEQENKKLKVTVTFLQNENALLHKTVEMQANRIAELEQHNKNGGK